MFGSTILKEKLMEHAVVCFANFTYSSVSSMTSSANKIESDKMQLCRDQSVRAINVHYE